MNLHHTLFREAARLDSNGQLAPLDTTGLGQQEKEAWDRAVGYYRRAFAGKRLLFDEGLIHVNELLATAPDDGGTALPSGLERDQGEQLASVADLYRRHWWPQHDGANRAWVATMQPRIASTGAAIASELERLLKAPWPTAPQRIEVAYYVAEVGGAYTTGQPGLTTLASGRVPDDWSGYEVLFHETAHTMTTPLTSAIDHECRAQQKNCAHLWQAKLWHAVQFYTVGEVVRKELARAGVPNYVPYAEKLGLYRRGGWDAFKPALERAWQPYLDGATTMEKAVSELVRLL